MDHSRELDTRELKQGGGNKILKEMKKINILISVLQFSIKKDY